MRNLNLNKINEDPLFNPFPGDLKLSRRISYLSDKSGKNSYSKNRNKKKNRS